MKRGKGEKPQREPESLDDAKRYWTAEILDFATRSISL
jgi:hypothetical protein